MIQHGINGFIQFYIIWYNIVFLLNHIMIQCCYMYNILLHFVITFLYVNADPLDQVTALLPPPPTMLRALKIILKYLKQTWWFNCWPRSSHLDVLTNSFSLLKALTKNNLPTMELFDTSLEFLINSAQTMTFYDVAEITKNQQCTGNPSITIPVHVLFFYKWKSDVSILNTAICLSIL